MIHVGFGLHDKTGRYSKFAGTAMLSIFENTNSEVTVHILHDNTLTQDNREKFIYLAGEYRQLVKFYNVEELCAEKISQIFTLIPAVKTSRTTIGTFFKFLIVEVLPKEVEKIIYVDSDMLVNLDINKLWQIELEDKILAAAPEAETLKLAQSFLVKRKFIIAAGFVNRDDYFNAGVLIMNLKVLRDSEKNIKRGVKWRGEHPQCDCFDQDIWNYLFSKNYLKLPGKFNVMVDYQRRISKGQIQMKEAIYHYASHALSLNNNDPFNRLWMKFFVKTPWFDEETIGRLYSGIQQLHIELKQSMVNLSAMMSGKTRTFFTPPHDIDGLKKFFSVRDDEEIILAENQQSLQKLIDAMKKSQGKKIFFIMLPNFSYQILIQAGFIPNKDFVNGLDFLSEAQGVPLNSYQFIKGM